MFSLGPDKSVKSSLKRKSARRRMKESAWWSKQKEMDQHAVEVDRVTRSKAPCKYYLNGFCKNVSVLMSVYVWDTNA